MSYPYSVGANYVSQRWTGAEVVAAGGINLLTAVRNTAVPSELIVANNDIVTLSFVVEDQSGVSSTLQLPATTPVMRIPCRLRRLVAAGTDNSADLSLSVFWPMP